MNYQLKYIKYINDITEELYNKIVMALIKAELVMYRFVSYEKFQSSGYLVTDNYDYFLTDSISDLNRSDEMSELTLKDFGLEAEKKQANLMSFVKGVKAKI